MLSVYKDGTEVEQQLRQLPLPEPDACIAVLEKSVSTSSPACRSKALRCIVPLMEAGARYDEVWRRFLSTVTIASASAPMQPSLYLLPFYEAQRRYGKNDRVGSMQFRETPTSRNPRVLRALTRRAKWSTP